MPRMTVTRESESSRSQSSIPALKELQLRGSATVLLGLCAGAMLIDLLPALGDVTGLYSQPYFTAVWLLVFGIPLNGGTLVLLPIGIRMARRAAPRSVLKGTHFYLVATTLALFTLKALAYWIIHLREGRYLTLPLSLAVVVVSAAALWAWKRARASGTTLRPALYLLVLLIGLFLTELAVYATRNL
jgi:hypothetical protein